MISMISVCVRQLQLTNVELHLIAVNQRKIGQVILAGHLQTFHHDDEHENAETAESTKVFNDATFVNV